MNNGATAATKQAERLEQVYAQPGGADEWSATPKIIYPRYAKPCAAWPHDCRF